MPPRTLSRLALNRATLARQGLLAPIMDGSIADAVAGVGSLQAQHPEWPPIALWSRAGDRAIAGLPNALADHSVVRAALMRITVHVVAAHDFWPMSVLTQPLRRLQFRSFFKADADRLASGPPAQDGLGTVRVHSRPSAPHPRHGRHHAGESPSSPITRTASIGATSLHSCRWSTFRSRAKDMADHGTGSPRSASARRRVTSTRRPRSATSRSGTSVPSARRGSTT